MTNIRKATTEDIKLINELAWIAFPATYKDILTKEQIDYMMDWMYSPENLHKQMTEEGHIYYLAYVDKATGFISYKSKSGKELKALELPGLWNGAMSDWSTVFVEVPLGTFNPVKTVNDLLREQHQ